VDRETPGELDLYVVDASTYPPGLAQKVNLQLPVGGDVTEKFEWSFDGRRLAYLADQNEYQTWELYVAEIVDGVVQSAQRVNAPLPPLSDVDSFDWSPDGTRLVYIADQDTADAYEAYVVDVSAPEPWSAVKINDILQDEDSDVIEARWGNCPPN
jgi:Tol biopolymer transport system component